MVKIFADIATGKSEQVLERHFLYFVVSDLGRDGNEMTAFPTKGKQNNEANMENMDIMFSVL